MPDTKQTTAMMQWIEWLNEFDNTPIKPTYANMREKAWQLLAVEKQQHSETYNDSREKQWIDFDTYYNNTFKQ